MVSRDWNPQIGRKLDSSWVLGEYDYELEISKTKTKGARTMASLAENTTSVDISGRAFWRKQYPDASTAFIVFQSGKNLIASEITSELTVLIIEITMKPCKFLFVCIPRELKSPIRS